MFYFSMSCVLCFHFPCPHVSSKFLLCSPLWLPLSVFVPFMFSYVLLPLVTSPGILPPLSSPVPRHVISVCVFSLCVPFTPCPVIVFCLYSVFGCSCSCSCSCFLLPVSCLVGFGFILHFFPCLIVLWHWFELCIFALLLCLILGCYFVFHPCLSAFGFCKQLLNKSSPFCLFPWSCLLCNCVWVHLPFHSLPFLPQPDKNLPLIQLKLPLC